MSGVSNHAAISVPFISDLNKSLYSELRRLIDWLLGCCCFGPIDSSISAICSIILSSGIRPKPCQQMQHSTPLTVIGLPLQESLDLIWKGTWPTDYKLSSAPCWHLSTVIVLQFALALAPTRPFLCRAPIRRGLLLLSWWGWSSQAPTLLWGGRRDSALPLSPSMLTESCRSCWHWQVLFLPFVICLSLMQLIAVSSPSW